MAADIHPTAIVAAGAEIGDGCTVGPYCVIGPRVRLGAGCRLHSHVVLDGITRIGDACEIFPFACVGGRTQDLKYAGDETYVTIGKQTTLREYVTVHAATQPGATTAVGDSCHVLAYCHIAHDCVVGNHVIMSNGTTLAGHVTVEDRVVFGGLCGVHQFTRIGTLAMVGAMAKVVQDVVPYVLVEGNPAEPATVNRVGLRRNGKSDELIARLNQAYKTLFRSNLRLEDALDRLLEQHEGVAEVQHLLTFIRGSERGLARPKGHTSS